MKPIAAPIGPAIEAPITAPATAPPAPELEELLHFSHMGHLTKVQETIDLTLNQSFLVIN
ncbi:hypothetical protein A2318_03695 [Candidatus Uhrbacteria bacterium RIFOXYB2_FULL_45_11]|uniref:Uncharacterized protein n=1 Tax=Candidatus Uhrbacteria bacterium RIFOXYB2_FULL_45_11 TaxID=1802421 RepID=A0A1F7W364_9BACT|nr:MAG: hypothetical protein A2318_03695 [Candidatus Uhrbacteria bacterium RIFOXYB2_FULL_45_11]